MRNFSKYLKLFTFAVFFFAAAQPSIAQDERERKVKREMDNKKNTSQEELREELIKRHRAGQTKETRKRIKRSKREAKRRKQGKNPVPWWERMFRRKKHRKKRKKRS